MGGTILLGSNGRLASFIRKIHPEAKCYDKDTLDIANREDVIALIEKEKPSLIINCAAITDVEYCETHKDECWKVNAEAVKFLAEAADKVKAKLIHFSSNYAINPINEYGKAKEASEKYASKNGLVMRTDLYDTKTYIVKKLLFTEEALNAYDDKFFNPIYMGTMAELIFKLKDRTGVMNIVTKERLSMYEFALKICKVFGIDKSRVKPVKSAEEAGKAKRPKEIYLKPDVDISITDDLKRFKNELEK